jgi:hypothetical protein
LLEDLIKLVARIASWSAAITVFDIAYEEPVRFLNGVKSLTAEQKQQIVWSNAARLLRL